MFGVGMALGLQTTAEAELDEKHKKQQDPIGVELVELGEGGRK